MWRLRPTVLLAAGWTWWAITIVRSRKVRDGIRTVSPRPPRLPRSAGKGVNAVLTRFSPTCLERALVAQAWLVAHGELVNVVIGVPAEGIGQRPAHAWLDGRPDPESEGYVVLHTLTPADPTRSARSG